LEKFYIRNGSEKIHFEKYYVQYSGPQPGGKPDRNQGVSQTATRG